MKGKKESIHKFDGKPSWKMDVRKMEKRMRLKY
jgi:hypothetical protein